MSAPANTATPTRSLRSGRPGSADGRLPRLRGLYWLVWRQHRSAFWTLLGATALALAYVVFRRAEMTDYLNGFDWPDPSPSDDWQTGFAPYVSHMQLVAFALGCLPVLLGVFLGAPMFAQDLENGTAKLVTSQAVGRVRWLVTKLGITMLVVVVSTVALSTAFGWWWQPISGRNSSMTWSSGAVFDTTGPVPVALALFTVAGGAAIGMLLRRTLPAMVVTFGFAVVTQLIWTRVRLELGDVVRATTTNGVRADDSWPALPAGAEELDQSYITDSGELLGWSTCAHEPSEQAVAACLDEAGVVGWAIDYLPVSQMPSMQWLGSGVLFALTAAVVVFLCLWGRKRVV